MDTALDTAIEAIVAAMRAELKELLAELGQAERLSLAEAEQEVLAFVRGFGGQLLERGLALRGSGNEGAWRECSCGGQQKHQGKRARRLVTLLGEVRIGRAYYQCPHCHRTAVPLDEQLGLGSGQLSWGLQQAVGQLSGALPFEPAMEMLAELTGVRVCAKTAQVVSEALGEEVVQAQQQEVEGAFTGEAEPEAESAPERLYAALDGTLVRTEQGWKEGKLGAVYEPEDETQAGEISYVSGYLSAEAFGEQVYVEALRRGVEQAQEQVVLGDGAAWIWNLADTHFPGAVQILDWYHVKSRMWELGQALYGEGSPKTARWVEAKLDKLWGGQVEAVLADLRRLQPKDKQARELVRQTRGYLHNNKARMRYPEFRARGYHIGSGVVESACKHVIAQRQKLAGMRWSLAGAAAILALRTLVINRRWRRFWSQRRPP